MRERAYAAHRRGGVLGGGLDDVEGAGGLGVARRAPEQLGAAEYGGERVVEVVRDAGGELPQRAQLVGLRGALALQPLLGHVARDREDPRRAALDDERRRVRDDVAHAPVLRREPQLQGLRLAGERAPEALLGQRAVVLLDQLAEVGPDQRLLRRGVHRRARAVDPHDAPFGVDGADVLARALQDVL